VRGDVSERLDPDLLPSELGPGSGGRVPCGRRAAAAHARHPRSRRRHVAGASRGGVGRRGRRGHAGLGLGDRRMTRPEGRAGGELRPVTFDLGFQEWADGSVLFSMGKTRVLCAASLAEDTPRWLRGTGRGWVTGEYSMLPASTL